MTKKLTILLLCLYTTAICGQTWDVDLRQALRLDTILCQSEMIVFERWLDEENSPVDTIFIDPSPQNLDLAMQILDSLPIKNIDDVNLIAKLENILDEYSAKYLVQYAFTVNDYQRFEEGRKKPRLFMYHYYPVEKRMNRSIAKPNPYEVLKKMEAQLVVIPAVMDTVNSFVDYLLKSELHKNLPQRKSPCFKNDKYMGVGPFLDFYPLVKHKHIQEVKEFIESENLDITSISRAIGLYYNHEYSLNKIATCRDFKILINKNTNPQVVDYLAKVNNNYHNLPCINKIVEDYYASKKN